MIKGVNDKIKAYMGKRGIKQDVLVKALESDSSTVSRMLNGKRVISADEYFIICKTLEVAPSFFDW